MNGLRGSLCRSCGAPIKWGKTMGGSLMPLDADPDPDKGTFVLGEAADGHVAIPLSGFNDGTRESAQRQDVQLYVSHFATCPNAAQHRRRS